VPWSGSCPSSSRHNGTRRDNLSSHRSDYSVFDVYRGRAVVFNLLRARTEMVRRKRQKTNLTKGCRRRASAIGRAAGVIWRHCLRKSRQHLLMRSVPRASSSNSSNPPWERCNLTLVKRPWNSGSSHFCPPKLYCSQRCGDRSVQSVHAHSQVPDVATGVIKPFKDFRGSITTVSVFQIGPTRMCQQLSSWYSHNHGRGQSPRE
jgi:hypothetical protein